jgi:outer membrane protein assembly factor BamA
VRRKRIAAVLIAVAVAIGGIAFLVRHLKGVLEERARAALEARGAALSGGRVSVERVRVSLLPPRASIMNLRFDRAGNRGSQAAAAIERIDVAAGPLTLLGLRRGPIAVTVARPRLRLVLAEGRPLDLGEGALPPVSLLALVPDGSSLAVREADLELGIAGGPEARLGGVTIGARAAAAAAAVRGRVEWSDGACRGLLGDWEGLRGEAAFEATPDGARLESLSVRGAGIALSGTLTAGAAGVAGELLGSLEIARLKRFVPPASSASGRAEARLAGEWREGALRARGDVSGVGIVLWGVPIDSVRSELAIDADLRLSGIRAHLFGGEASGAMRVAFGRDGPRAEADLRLDGVDLAQVLQYAGWHGPALSGTIHYRGTHRIGAAGLGTLAGSGVLDAVGHYRTPRGADLPLEITSGLTTEGEALRLDGGTIRAGSVRGSFSGRVTREDGVRLRLKGATGDITEILPLFAAPPGAKPPPKPAPTPKPTPKPAPTPPSKSPGAAGAARPAGPGPAWVAAAPAESGGASVVAARLRGRPRAAPPVRLAVRSGAPWPGRVRSAALRPSGAALRQAGAADPARPESPLERMLRALGGEWAWSGDLHYLAGGLQFEGRLDGSGLVLGGSDPGTLEASVRYADERLVIHEATLRVSGGAARLAGEVDFRGAGSVSVEATAAGFPIEPLLVLAGVALPVQGRLDGRVTLGGRPASPAGRAVLGVGAVRVAGVRFDGLKGELLFTPDLVTARDLVLSQGGGTLRIEGSVAYRGDPAVLEEAADGPPRLSISGRGLDLTAWREAIGGLPLRGTAAVEGTIGGSIRAPTGSLRLRGEDVRVDGRGLGDLEIEADLGGGGMRLRGKAPRHGVTVEGTVGLGDGWPADLALTIAAADLEAADLWGDTPADLELSIAGRVEARGPLLRPREIAARARLDRFAATVAGVGLAAEGPIEMTLDGPRLRLQPLVLAGEGTRIEVRGSGPLAGGGPVELVLSGRFDLKLLRPLVRDLQVTGRGEVEATVGGTRDRPSVAGTLRASAGAVRLPAIPFPIDDLEASAVFQESRLRLESLRLLAGGGPIEGSGFIDLAAASAGAPAAGRWPGPGWPLALAGAEVRFRGRDVKSDFPEGFRSVMDLDVVLRRGPDGTTLSGVLDLVKGVYSRDFRVESSLIRGRAPEIFEVEAAPGPLEDVRLDLAVRTSGEVWLRNDFGSIEGQGSLQIGGTVGRPAVSGRITAIEGGTIRFRSVRYRVQSGTIDFNDPERVNPVFNLLAETRVAEYQVSLRVEGTQEDFRYELTSSPPLPQPDIVSLLLTGRTLGTLGPEGTALAEEAVSGYLAGRLTEELTERLSGRAGLDVIAIDPMAVNGQGDPTTRVTLGKQVTPELFVTYANELGSTQGSIYQLDYALGRDFTFTSIRDRDGSIGGDFKFILRGDPPGPPAAAGAAPFGGREGPAALAGPAAAQRPTIGAVRLEGRPLYREAKLRRILGLKPGRARDRAAVNDGIDRLLKFYRERGHLMAEVDYDERPGAPGTVDLAVQVDPGPRIVVELEGVRGRGRLRSMVAPYWEKGLFLEEIAAAATTRLRAHYRDHGYLSAEIRSEVLESTEAIYRLRFVIRRGPRVQAREVRVAGAGQIPEAEILKVVRSRPDTAGSRGLVRESVLREDVAEIRTLYLARGFHRVVVPPPDVVLDSSGRKALVVFHVEEGPRVVVGAVRFQGASALSPEALAAAAALPPGAPYTAEEAERAVVRLRRRYDDAGFPEARVRYRLEIDGDAAAAGGAAPRDAGTGGAPAGGAAAGARGGGAAEGERAADVVFAVEEGPRQVVGRVEVRGNLLTRDAVIREALGVTPGQALSRGDLLAGQTRLYGRGIFSQVAVEADAGSVPAAGAPGQGGGRERPVRVTVREAAPLSQVFGIGYDTEDRARGQYEIAHRNLAGTGRYLGLQTRASGVQQRASVLYREQGLFGGRFDGLASAFWEDEERPAFDVRTIGSSLQLSRQVSRATRALYRLSLRDVNLSDATASFEGTTVRLSNLSSSLVHDTRDALFDPRRGHYVSGELQLFGRAIGSEAEFGKLYAQVFLFREVLPRTVWAQALRAGAAIPFGRSDCDPVLTLDPLCGVTPSERFFAGGDTTVRGFKRDRLGPIDAATDDPLGGEGIVLINEELRFPIFRKLQGVVFYDAGNVFPALEDYDLSDLRHVAGLGLRLATPIGPFRVEYGAILDREPGEPRGEFFLSIGQAF